MFRVFLKALVAFLGCALAAYLVVLFGTLGVWEMFDVVDRDGGGGMAVAFGIAPLVAVIAGIVGGLVAWVRAQRTHLASHADPLSPPGSTAAFGPGVGAIIGALALYLPTRAVIWVVLGRNEYDALWKALAHAWTPTVLAMGGAAVGWQLTRRARGQR